MLIRDGNFYVFAGHVRMIEKVLPKEGAEQSGIRVLFGNGSERQYYDVLGSFDAVEIDYGGGNIQTFLMVHGLARIDVDKNEFGIAKFIKSDKNTVFYDATLGVNDV